MIKTIKKQFLYTNKKAKNSLLKTKRKIQIQKNIKKTQILMTKIFLLSKYKTNQKNKQKPKHKKNISMFKIQSKPVKLIKNKIKKLMRRIFLIIKGKKVQKMCLQTILKSKVLKRVNKMRYNLTMKNMKIRDILRNTRNLRVYQT